MTASGDVLVELKLADGWTNITSDVRVEDEITITRGRTSESGTAPPVTANLTLDNRTGKYTPKNPLGPLYGQLTRNVPIRIGIKADATYDAFSQSSGTGDLSFTHTPAGTPTGVILFLWELTPTAGGVASVTYGGVPMTRRQWIGATLGSLTRVGAVYFANGVPAGPQQVVVDTTTTATRYAAVHTLTGGTTCELDNVGWNHSNATPSANPQSNMATNSRSALFGSLLSDLDDGSTISPSNSFTESGEVDLGTETAAASRWPTSLNPSTYSFRWNAASGHWAIMTASVRAVNYRFVGEVSEFPGRYELGLTEARMPIEAAGVLRRMQQRDAPSATGLRSFLEPAPYLFRYWPLSGAAGTQYSLDIAPIWGQQATGFRFYSEGLPGQFKYGEPLEISETGGSDDSNYLGTGMALFHTNTGAMRADVANGYANWAVDFVFQAPKFGSLTMFFPDYSGGGWSINWFGSVPGLQVGYTDPATGPIGFLPVDPIYALTDQAPHHVRFQVEKVGADSKFTLWIDGVQVSTGTQSGYVSSGLALVRFYYARADGETWLTLAHLAVFADQTSAAGFPSAAAMTDAARGYAGEAAGVRMQRILALAKVPLTVEGTMASTMPMGPQANEPMMNQLRDAENADLGILTEPRDTTGLLYRAHATFYNQAAALSLSLAGGQVATPFEPVDDDQVTRNDVTVKRRGGDEFRLSRETGPMSAAEPPLGVGRYADEVTVNVASETLLPPYAGWLLHLGTLDAPRYPSVTVNLAAPAAAGLVAQALAVDVGDRINVTGCAAIYSFDDLNLLVVGYSERIGAVEHTITYVCVPGDRYVVAAVDSARVDSGDSSTLTAGVTAGATTLSVASSGFLWTTAGGDMPLSLMVNGEEMTVTAISGATSPQTFTVTRGVNGVARAHAAGAVVRLKSPAILAL